MKASKEVLEALHGVLAKELARRIEDGSATAADLSVARQMLKDNNIDSTPAAGSPLANLRDSLPFPSVDAAAEDAAYN